MTLLRLCGLAVLAAVMALSLREAGGRLAPLAALCGGLALLAFVMMRYREVFASLTELGGGEAVSEALSLGLRVIGLAAVTEITAGVCRDLGEASLATKVEWCGRAEILVVSLPSLSRLLSLAASYLS